MVDVLIEIVRWVSIAILYFSFGHALGRVVSAVREVKYDKDDQVFAAILWPLLAAFLIVAALFHLARYFVKGLSPALYTVMMFIVEAFCEIRDAYLRRR